MVSLDFGLHSLVTTRTNDSGHYYAVDLYLMGQPHHQVFVVAPTSDIHCHVQGKERIMLRLCL